MKLHHHVKWLRGEKILWAFAKAFHELSWLRYCFHYPKNISKPTSPYFGLVSLHLNEKYVKILPHYLSNGVPHFMSFVFTPIPSLFGPEDALALGQAAAVTSGHRPSGIPMVPSGLIATTTAMCRCVTYPRDLARIVQHRATSCNCVPICLELARCAFWFGLSHSEEKNRKEMKRGRITKLTTMDPVLQPGRNRWNGLAGAQTVVPSYPPLVASSSVGKTQLTPVKCGLWSFAIIAVLFQLLMNLWLSSCQTPAGVQVVKSSESSGFPPKKKNNIRTVSIVRVGSHFSKPFGHLWPFSWWTEEPAMPPPEQRSAALDQLQPGTCRVP